MRFAYLYIVVLMVLGFASCKKYLDEKSDIKLSVPQSLDDFQGLLDNPNITENSSPQVGDLGCDDYYFATVQALTIPQNCNIWASDTWQGQNPNDWITPYKIIYTSNIVIEGLNDLKNKGLLDQTKWNTIFGHALFLRATYHYFLEETFGQPYKPASATSDLGIPIKLSSDLGSKAVRSKVSNVYTQIISDLVQAKDFLPLSTTSKNRPSKAAAFAMLARVYLTMQDYDKAGKYSDSTLQLRSALYDFNLMPSSIANGSNPFSAFTPPNDLSFETIYTCYEVNYGIIRQAAARIDSNLYASYNINDLRKTIFFQKNNSTNTYFFKGNYSGNSSKQLSGPTIDEMYLIRAECFARAGNKDAALADLNTLMIKRWKNNGSWVPFTALSDQEALQKILVERRKELIFRGIRWTDLRRLNQDPQFAKTIIRVLNGQTYQLLPNDPKYTYPIPDAEIRLSGIQQNPR